MKMVLFTLCLIAGIGCSGSGPVPGDVDNTDIGDVFAMDGVAADVPDAGIVSDVADAGSGDTAVCEHFHFFGDQTYGLNCWAPPEDLCKDGADQETSWYCKPDGSLCCLTPWSGCFYCGWIECGPVIGHVSDECQVIDIPQKYVDCAADSGLCATNSPDVAAEMTEGECQFLIDQEYSVCWDDHVDELE